MSETLAVAAYSVDSVETVAAYSVETAATAAAGTCRQVARIPWTCPISRLPTADC